MSFSKFTRNENKSIIWGLLHEVGVFNDIPNTQVENVKKIFEQTVLSMKPDFDVFFDNNDEGDDDYDAKASIMITNSNKTVIKKMVDQVGVLKGKRPMPQNVNPVNMVNPVNPMVPQQRAAPISTKKPKIEEIYRADDLQNNRMSELEIRLKEKQVEMDNMLNNKKPDQIDFTDKSISDDKLSSNEMERLLAEALSSRERELVVPAAASNKGGVNSIIKPQESVKKNVSFNEYENEKIVYDGDTSLEPGPEPEHKDRINKSEDEDTSIIEPVRGLSFLSKLKKASGDVSAMVSNPNTSYVRSRIPLDDIMALGGMDDEDEGDVQNLEMRITERRKTDETASAGESQKLNEKINIIQNELQDIKRIQDRILNLLEGKYNP
jgi:hypothetical protein